MASGLLTHKRLALRAMEMAEPRALEAAIRQESGGFDGSPDTSMRRVMLGTQWVPLLRSSEDCVDSHNFQSVGAVLILLSGGNTEFDALAPFPSRELVCNVRTRAAVGRQPPAGSLTTGMRQGGRLPQTCRQIVL
ncbi:hypothetical protein ASG77_19165 [Arthrobacter sp. Soil762]|nr:hypothetical protein ASG77_19165 [Arthrobacter sp. Soil762]